MRKSLTFQIEADELDIFLQDVNEHLQQIEAGLLSLEQIADPNMLHSVFRAAHTLKAIAGTIGHQRMAELTHALENLFDAMREGLLTLTPEIADELLAMVSLLRALRDEVVSRKPCGANVEAAMKRLRQLADSTHHQQITEPARPHASPTLNPDQLQIIESCRENECPVFDISVTVDRTAHAPAARLLQAALTLAEAGQVIDQHPTEAELLEDHHSGSLRLILASAADASTLETQLAEITDLVGISIQPYGTALTQSPDTQTDAPAVPAAVKLEAQTQPAIESTVRISVERLDTLMNLAGEMIIERTHLDQINKTLQSLHGKEESLSALDTTIAHLQQLINQLQDEVMRTRLLPIGHLFGKFPRMVRDIARASGKQINLVIEGEETELDRSIIDAINDPLMHLLRNAADHGIETPERRSAAGKPPTGNIQLKAEHQEGQIIVVLQDDGQGIDPQRIRQAAVRHGLLSDDEAAHLSDDEAIALIFRPGLSTAEQITDVSGRGVGLDVVRANISRIGGSVLVESELGKGTTFRVLLPLTLAIVQTMLVSLGEDVYAIPLTSVIESLHIADSQISSIYGSPAIHWRDHVLPLLHLRTLFDNPRRAAPVINQERRAVVVVAWGRFQAGLLVDQIIGKQEIVVKPFGTVIGNILGLLGCTIMGDGRIALIVDIPSLINTAMQERKRANS